VVQGSVGAADGIATGGVEGISKSHREAIRRGKHAEGVPVSRLCGEIDERVQAFLARPIEGDWPYVWLDATHVKVRRDHHNVSVAVIVAGGGASAPTAGGRCSA
jgi:putative transposase